MSLRRSHFSGLIVISPYFVPPVCIVCHKYFNSNFSLVAHLCREHSLSGVLIYPRTYTRASLCSKGNDDAYIAQDEGAATLNPPWEEPLAAVAAEGTRRTHPPGWNRGIVGTPVGGELLTGVIYTGRKQDDDTNN